MTGTELIAKFELYVDDSTELSTVEELALVNKIYKKILINKPWEFLKKEWSSTTDGNAYIALPSDFGYFVENYNYTDNSFGTDIPQSPKVIIIDGNAWKIVNWSDRRKYTDNKVCYIDVRQDRLYFASTPASGLTISADYIYTPDDITASTSPVFPVNYHDMIFHGMAVDDMIIQLFDKARSYANENNAKYNSYMEDLSWYNSQFVNM